MDDDRASMEAAGGRTDEDVDNLYNSLLPTTVLQDLSPDTEYMQDVPPLAEPESLPPPKPSRHTDDGSTSAQEDFLRNFMPSLHALMHCDPRVDLIAMARCLNSAVNLYDHLIKVRLPETSEGVFLMYDTYFQPLMREVLPAAMHQLLHDERQAQFINLNTAEDYRSVCSQFIRLVSNYLRLHVSLHGSGDMPPTIDQQVGADLEPMLRTLAELLGSNTLLYCRAFNANHPSTARGWRALGLGTWAASPHQQQESAVAGATSSDMDGPGGRCMSDGGVEPTAEPPQTPSCQLAAAAWQAAMVDSFGIAGGWDILLQLVSQPERLGDHLWAFLQPLAAAAPQLLPAHRAALLQPVAKVLDLVRAGLAAAPDLSALEGSGAKPEQRVAKVLILARHILSAASTPEAAAAEVGPLQHEHVLRLLCAPSFTRQLAGIKQLRQLVAWTFYQTQLQQGIEVLTGWLQQHNVVQLVLKSNLHQAQYAEQAQHVLGTLLQHGALSEGALAFLWQLTQDATTFEGVKSNAYSILASLGPHMQAEQLKQLFQRLQARAAASGVIESASICTLLVGMAQRDTKGSMQNGVLECLLSIQLRADAPPEVASSQAVVELCSTYDSLLGQDLCSKEAAKICISQLEGDCAVPAAVVLHTLLTHIWHKPDRMRAIMQDLNQDAHLIKQCLRHHSSWLQRQRAEMLKAAAATVGGTASAALGTPLVPSAAAGAWQPSGLLAEAAVLPDGPAAGAFSHRQAVDAWHHLLLKVVRHGNYYLLQEQLEYMVVWATKDAVMAYDSGRVWRLVLLMVANGRKEVQKDVASAFFETCLCQLRSDDITPPAWRCFIAYMAAISDWAVDIQEHQVSVQDAWVTEGNQDAVRQFLWHVALEAHDCAIAQAASRLLAMVVSRQMGRISHKQDGAWRQLLAAEVATRLQQLTHLQDPAQLSQAAWVPGVSAEGAAALGVDEPQQRHVQPGCTAQTEQNLAAQHCQRILGYLGLLVEECQGKRMLTPQAHRSSWRGFPMAIVVQLPAQQGHKPHKQELQLPSNLPVGQLRRTVGEWLAKAPQFVRLLGGGREFDNDGQTLAAVRAGQQLIMAQINLKSNQYSGHNIAHEQAATAATEAIVQQPGAYSLVVSLAQAPIAAAAGSGSSSRSSVAAAALQLLELLPTCAATRQQLCQVLLGANGRQQLRQLLLQQPHSPPQQQCGPEGVAAERVKSAELMYAVQCLCALLFPLVIADRSPTPAAGPVAEASLSQELLQQRLLLSGALAALLELATLQVAAQGGAAAADPVVVGATHASMLLLLHHTHAALEQQKTQHQHQLQQLLAQAASQQEAAMVEPQQAGAAAAQEAVAAEAAGLSESTSMQIDNILPGSVGGANDDGGSLQAAAAATSPAAAEEAAAASLGTDAIEGTAAAAAAAAAASLGTDAIEGTAAPACAATATAASMDAELAPPSSATDVLEAATAALASLAPAIAHYILQMLSCVLHCQPGEQHQHRAAHATEADSDEASVIELCTQGLLLLKQLAQQSSAAVHVITATEAAAAEAVVRRLLLHPTSSHLRLLASEWLPDFAAAAPAAHRWAFERLVQPLLLADSSGCEAGVSSQEHMALCTNLIETLDASELPAARQLLGTLLHRLSTAIGNLAPIDDFASVVGALIRRLDCREVGMTHNLVYQLIHGCCFPVAALTHTATSSLNRVDADVAQSVQAQEAAAADANSAAERCIVAARAQGASRSSSNKKAAFDLLLDLVLHDSSCWQQAQEQLQTVVHAAAGPFFTSSYNNIPLSALRSPGTFAGLLNGGATCYMSSVFQQLFMQPTIRQLVLSAPAVAAEEQQDSVFHQMQVMFAHLVLGVEPWFEPRGFWRTFKDYNGQPVNIREHQDAYEFFTRLQDSVDEHLRAQQQPRAIHAALGGTFAQLITVIEAPQHRSERDEEFYQISLDVRGKRTLTESLDSYVSKELMDGQNQYLCEEMGKKVDAEKRTLLKQLPNTLVLHLKRFEWDYETYQRWKVKDRFEFPIQLDMYPYTVEGADEADGREPSGKKAAGQYCYELRGVVIHSGSAFAGHYYSYIKDRQPDGGWYCFDDTSVDPWDVAKLDKDCFGGKFIPEGYTQECDRPNSAYMLFYERSAAVEQPDAAAAKSPGFAVAAATCTPAAPVLGAAAEDTPMYTPAEDTPMHTPEAGARAHTMAAVGPLMVDGLQSGGSPGSMPRAQQHSTAPEAAAAAGMAPTLSVQPQQVTEPAPVAKPAFASAGPATPYAMPSGLYESILISNLRQLGSMELLSLEYCQFIWQLTRHLQDAVAAGTARKAVKREPTSSPGGMDLSGNGSSGRGGNDCQLQALTSRRSDNLHAVIADVALLCLDYCLRVALRGGQALRREVLGAAGRKAAAGMQGVLLDAGEKIPSAATALLLHIASGPCTAALDVLLPKHPAASVRGFVRDVARGALDCLASQGRRTDEAVHATRCLVDHLCSVTVPLLLQPQAVWHPDQIFLLMSRLGLPRYGWRRALLDAHLLPLLALVRWATEQWAVLDASCRNEHSYGHSALSLLSGLLRRFHTEPSHEQHSRHTPPKHLNDPEVAPPADRNPFCLEGCELAPMPAEVVDWLYADTAFPRKLLMGGCVNNAIVYRLLAFLQYENWRQAEVWQQAMLDHLLHDVPDWGDLAQDAFALTQLICLDDSLYRQRVKNLLLGMDGAEGDRAPGLLKAMTTPQRGLGCQHLLLAMALAVLADASEELLAELLQDQHTWLDWAGYFVGKRIRKQMACQNDSSLLPDNPTYRELCEEGNGIEEMADLFRMELCLQDCREVVQTAATTSSSSGGRSCSSGDGSRGRSVGLEDDSSSHRQQQHGSGQEQQQPLQEEGNTEQGRPQREEPELQQRTDVLMDFCADEEAVVEIHSDGLAG